MAIPVNTSVPTITAQRVVGQTITGAAGTWTGSPTFAYQWQRAEVVYVGANVVYDDAEIVTGDWTDIASATSSTYAMVAADHRHLLRLRVIGTNGDGSSDPVYSAVMTKIATIAGGGFGAPLGGMLSAANEDEE